MLITMYNYVITILTKRRSTMKKILFALLTAVLAVTMMFALTSCGEPELEFVLSDDGSYYILDACALKKQNMEIEIPAEYEGKPVKEIADDAFYTYNGDSSLAKLTVPASVTIIHNNIGDVCRSDYLEGHKLSIYYGGSEQLWLSSFDSYLGYDLYINDTLVTSPTIPSDMTEIPDGYASSCASITEINIPDHVTAIGRSAFNGCTNVKTLTISKNVDSIGEYAFANLVNLTAFNYTAKNATVGDVSDSGRMDSDGAFYDLGVDSTGVVLTIGKSVEYIPAHFLNADANYSYEGINIKEFIIDDDCDLKGIGNQAFAKTVSSLDGLNEYEGVYYFGSESNPYMFLMGTTDLTMTSLTIHEDCKYILDLAFRDCDDLESVTIPEGVEYIGRYAFYRTTLTFENTSGWKMNDGTTKSANLSKVSDSDSDEYYYGITRMQ